MIFNQLDIKLRTYQYCYDNKRCKELEYIIGCDVGWSYLYATNVTHGRFKLGEEMIATHDLFSAAYDDFLDRL